MSASWVPRVAGVALLLGMATGGCARLESRAGVPECEPSGELVTVAQAVPSASLAPCIDDLPIGWRFSGMEVRDGRARFWLGNDRAGDRAVRVTLDEECDLSGATELPSERAARQRFLRLDRLTGRNAGAWLHPFDGGCITWEFTVPKDTYDFDAFNVELDAALDFFDRDDIGSEVERRYDAELDSATAGG